MKEMKLLALLLLGCLLPTASWALTGSLHDDTFFVKVPSGEVEQVIIERVENGEVTNVESSLSRLEVLGNDMINDDFGSCYSEPMPVTGQDVAETSESLQFHEVQPAGIGIRHMHRKVAPARPDCTFPQVVRSGQSNESVRLSGEICVIDLLSAAVVAGDYNNDGYVDLYFTVHSGPSRLYRNKGDGTFEDVTASTKIGPKAKGSGAVWADVDDDGDLDLYVTTVGDIRHYLYINQKNGLFFTEEAEAHGVSLQQPDGRMLAGMTPNIGDYDRDGFVDIYVTEWILDYIAVPAVSRMLRNRGAINPGYFEDSTERAGLTSVIIPKGTPGTFTFCSSFVDMDNDGWQDLIVTGDFGTSQVFWNNRNGTFTECTKDCGVTANPDAMGHSIGDWNVDGYLDWWMTAIHDDSNRDCKSVGCKFSKAGNVFYANHGNRSLLDVTSHVGVREGYWGWGNALIDFNNDCWLDFVMTNGWDDASTTVDDHFRTQEMRLWQNQGPESRGTTLEVSGKYNLRSSQSGRGLIKVDYDNDGDEDIVVANNVGAPSIFRNDGGNKNYWIKVKVMRSCFYMAKACHALGSRVQVISADGTLQTQEIGCGSHFMAQNELTAHFGLGANNANVTVKVTYPHRSDTVTITQVPVKKLLTVFEPFGFHKDIKLSYSSLRECRRPVIVNVTQPSLGHLSINPGGKSLSYDVDLKTLRDKIEFEPHVLGILNFRYIVDYKGSDAHTKQAGTQLAASAKIYYTVVAEGQNLEGECLPDGNMQHNDPPADTSVYTGFNNNEENPMWGSVSRTLRREFPSAYSDGIDMPAGQCPHQQATQQETQQDTQQETQQGTQRPTCPYHDEKLAISSSRPSPRLISNVLFAQDEDHYNDLGLNDLHTQFGQFLAHDTDLTTPLPSFDPSAHTSGLWLPIPVPKGDVSFDRYDEGNKYLPFTRSSYALLCTGEEHKRPMQQINKITSVLDANQVYGSSAKRNSLLRTHSGGEMLVQSSSHGDMLPFNTFSLPNDNPLGRDGDHLFIAGDVRCNVQPGLMALHTLFIREHNRLCRKYRASHSNATDEEIFQHARRFVIAEMQAITFREYLPAVLGTDLPPYSGYNDLVNPDVGNVFATASFRFGHSQVNSRMWRLNEDGSVAKGGHLLLREGYFAPERLLRQGGMEPLFAGSIHQRAQEIDTKMVDEMRNVLFSKHQHDSNLDLAAINIQRGRDHGLPDYNTVREGLGLKRVSSFEEISSDNTTVESLRLLYPSVDDIDVWVGGLAEDKSNKYSSVGETFEANLIDNFRRIRQGDRFWYENIMTPEEIEEVNRMTLLEVIRHNTDLKAADARHSFFSPEHCLMIQDSHCVTVEPFSSPATSGMESASDAADVPDVPSALPAPTSARRKRDSVQSCSLAKISKSKLKYAMHNFNTVLLAEARNIMFLNGSAIKVEFAVVFPLSLRMGPANNSAPVVVHHLSGCQCIPTKNRHYFLIGNGPQDILKAYPVSNHRIGQLPKWAEKIRQ